MGVDHRRLYAAMAEQLLHRADIVARFQEMRREAVTQRVTGGRLAQARGNDGSAERALHDRFVEVVTAVVSRARGCGASSIGWEYVLPGKLPGGSGLLDFERGRQPAGAAS